MLTFIVTLCFLYQSLDKKLKLIVKNTAALCNDIIFFIELRVTILIL